MSVFKREDYGLIGPMFAPLEHEVRSHVATACAAYHLGRKPQTLRVWFGQSESMVD